MPEIWIICRKVPGKSDTLQVLKDGVGWAIAYVGESAGKNVHIDVRLYFTEKERSLGLRQAGAAFKGNNVPKFMTLEEFTLQTTLPKKEESPKK